MYLMNFDKQILRGVAEVGGTSDEEKGKKQELNVSIFARNWANQVPHISVSQAGFHFYASVALLFIFFCRDFQQF